MWGACSRAEHKRIELQVQVCCLYSHLLSTRPFFVYSQIQENELIRNLISLSDKTLDWVHLEADWVFLVQIVLVL